MTTLEENMARAIYEIDNPHGEWANILSWVDHSDAGYAETEVARYRKMACAAAAEVKGIRMGLTKKQALLVEFLESSRDYEGATPSYQEMADALNLKSKSGIHRLIISLEERGVIRRLPHRARAIEVVA